MDLIKVLKIKWRRWVLCQKLSLAEKWAEKNGFELVGERLDTPKILQKLQEKFPNRSWSYSYGSFFGKKEGSLTTALTREGAKRALEKGNLNQKMH